MTVILASGSPRRRELMERLGLPYQVVVSDVPERDARFGEDASDYAVELATLKARTVAELHPDDVVVAADTVVHLGEIRLGKPAGVDGAVEMLTLLAGKTHEVTTGVVVVCGGRLRSEAETTRVTMDASDEQTLRAYAQSGEPFDKAGGYGIQGLGGRLVVDIEGCFENVVGFPLHDVARILECCGVRVDSTGALCTHFGPSRPWTQAAHNSRL
jgi:septum formation protein